MRIFHDFRLTKEELNTLRSDTEHLLSKIVPIGAPTFQEDRRAKFIQHWLEQNTQKPVERDKLGNVWIDLSDGREEVHLFDAHIDTVCPEENVNLIIEGSNWRAPGVLDNGACCALLLAWVAYLAKRNIAVPILASFTVGEEGLGNLGGINAVLDRFSNRLIDAWVFDTKQADATIEAVGSNRYRLIWSTTGGHSWNNFGQANAIVEASSWISNFALEFSWEKNQRTFNIGNISGGSGINVIAPHAECTMEVRSTNPSFLSEVDQWLDKKLRDSKGACRLEIHCIGKRPAGSIPNTHPLVQTLRSAHQELEIPLNFIIAGTNANAILARNIPAITTGLAVGALAHTKNEYLDSSSLLMGVKKLACITQQMVSPKAPHRHGSGVENPTI